MGRRFRSVIWPLVKASLESPGARGASCYDDGARVPFSAVADRVLQQTVLLEGWLAHAEAEAAPGEAPADGCRDTSAPAAPPLVALYCHPSLDYMCMALSVLAAGAAFLPLDPTWPAARVALVVALAGPLLLLTTPALRPRLPDPLPGPNCRVHTVPQHQPPTANAQPGHDPRQWAGGAAADGDARDSCGPTGGAAALEELPYFAVLYTSGSTGTPLGVRQREAAWLQRLAWMQSRYPLRPGAASGPRPPQAAPGGAAAGAVQLEGCSHAAAPAPDGAAPASPSGSSGDSGGGAGERVGRSNGSGSTVFFSTAVSFIDHVWQLLAPLLSPALGEERWSAAQPRGDLPPHVGPCNVVIAPPGAVLQAAEFVGLLAEQGVSHLVSVPSILRHLLPALRSARSRLGALRLVVSSGEPLPVAMGAELLRALPGSVQLLNLYGCTEVTADCTWYDVARPPAAAEGDSWVPAGWPIGDTQILIAPLSGNGSDAEGAAVDPQASPDGVGPLHAAANVAADDEAAAAAAAAAAVVALPAGCVGEVWVSGSCLSAGYHFAPAPAADPEAAAAQRSALEAAQARFVRVQLTPDQARHVASAPAVSPAPVALYFRTGDLGSVSPSGCLRLMGRVDQQIKVGGARLDLAEVEARLLQHPAVRDAAVRAFRDGQRPPYSLTAAPPRVVAYVVLAGEPPGPSSASAAAPGGRLAQRSEGAVGVDAVKPRATAAAAAPAATQAEGGDAPAAVPTMGPAPLAAAVAAELQAWVAQWLPGRGGLPLRFLALQRLPRNPAGKLMRQQLPAPGAVAGADLAAAASLPGPAAPAQAVPARSPPKPPPAGVPAASPGGFPHALPPTSGHAAVGATGLQDVVPPYAPPLAVERPHSEVAVMRVIVAATGLEGLEATSDIFAAGASSLAAAEVAGALGVDVRLVLAYPSARRLAAALQGSSGAAGKRGGGAGPGGEPGTGVSAEGGSGGGRLTADPLVLRPSKRGKLLASGAVLAGGPTAEPARSASAAAPLGARQGRGPELLADARHTTQQPQVPDLAAAVRAWHHLAWSSGGGAASPAVLCRHGADGVGVTGAHGFRAAVAGYYGCGTPAPGPLSAGWPEAHDPAAAVARGAEELPPGLRCRWRYPLGRCVDAPVVHLTLVHERTTDGGAGHPPLPPQAQPPSPAQLPAPTQPPPRAQPPSHAHASTPPPPAHAPHGGPLSCTELLVACSHDGDVACLDAASGRPYWHVRLPARAEAGMAVALGGGESGCSGPFVVVACGDGRLYSLGLGDGGMCGSVECGGESKSAPALDPWMGAVWATGHGRALTVMRPPATLLARFEIGAPMSTPVCFADIPAATAPGAAAACGEDNSSTCSHIEPPTQHASSAAAPAPDVHLVLQPPRRRLALATALDGAIHALSVHLSYAHGSPVPRVPSSCSVSAQPGRTMLPWRQDPDARLQLSRLWVLSGSAPIFSAPRAVTLRPRTQDCGRAGAPGGAAHPVEVANTQQRQQQQQQQQVGVPGAVATVVVVVVGQVDGVVRALSLGEAVARQGEDEAAAPPPRVAWTTALRGNLFADLACAGGCLLAATHAGMLYGIDAQQGAVLWRLDLGCGPISAAPLPLWLPGGPRAASRSSLSADSAATAAVDGLEAGLVAVCASNGHILLVRPPPRRPGMGTGGPCWQAVLLAAPSSAADGAAGSGGGGAVLPPGGSGAAFARQEEAHAAAEHAAVVAEAHLPGEVFSSPVAKVSTSQGLSTLTVFLGCRDDAVYAITVRGAAD